MSNKKLKILLMGPVNGQLETLKTKLTSLLKSKAGPFDVCFCIGPFGSDVADMPLPVYVQQYQGTVQTSESNNTKEEPTRLAENLFFLGNELQQANIYSLHVNHNKSLVVASCPFSSILVNTANMKPLLDKVHHESYVGCDFLLTDKWPQGIHRILPEDTVGMTACFDVADLALKTRPRYHVVVSSGQFQQSAPFAHLPSSTSTVPIRHAGRFLALTRLKSPQEFRQLDKKQHKFVHALGLVPLFDMTSEDYAKEPQQLEANPYTDESYEKDASETREEASFGFSEAHARRIMAQEAGDRDDYRYKGNSAKQLVSSSGENHNSNTLFCHGLHKDVRGVLQQTGSIALLEAFEPHGICKVKRPPSTASYAFLEFASHKDAKQCLERLGGEITIHGIHLTLKWANAKNKEPQENPKKRRHYMTEADAQDSCTLYFKFPPKVLSAEMETATNDLQELMQQTLEIALAVDQVEEKVTAETEPALRVTSRRQDEQNFGFLEFASHVAASMALATLTTSTDGGTILLHQNGSIPLELQTLLQTKSHLLGIHLHWALDHVESSKKAKLQHGLEFERRHFPPDSRTDCWFCLASPTCERHLIVSVHDLCYIAMPKGPIHPHHVLIVPVTHADKGIYYNAQVSQEAMALQDQMAEYFATSRNMDLFVFERAIQTKGGYHAHVQCIPIDSELTSKLMSTLMFLAKSIPGFELKEINTDLSLNAILANQDDDNENEFGYFYAEIQSFQKKSKKRFLYKQGQKHVVPLQFGREVLATVLKNPDLAHWKACVKSQEEETEMTMALRKSFEAFHKD